jgi:hypothetical protein
VSSYKLRRRRKRMITPNQYLWMKWHKKHPNGTWEEYMSSIEYINGERVDHMAPRNRSGKKESRTRDLDHIMGSRFTERTGESKQGITEREYQEWRRKKYGMVHED